MSFHLTTTGHVKFFCEWGHGKGAPVNPKRPATIITDDGDGHYQAWGYTGKQRDALTTLAKLERRITHGDGWVAVRYGNGYVIERPPGDFWVENEDEFKPDIAKYPDIIAW